MFKRKRTAIIVIIILCLIVIPFALHFLPSYLSKNKKVNANILLVEGWLPTSAIKMAYDEFQQNKYDYIITTGVVSGFKVSALDMNGYLIFYPKDLLPDNNEVKNHSIEIVAYSEMEGENCAQFNLFINSTLIASFKADKKERKYAAAWTGSVSDIDSIMVQFTNDALGEFGDRNLYVEKVIIDKTIKIPSLNYSEYDIGKLDGKWRTKSGIFSYAELARNDLIAMNMDVRSVIAVQGKMVKINRTLTSALAVADWLKTTDIKITGINIISYGMHSRRTWMVYNKVLNKSYKIGIVSLPDYKNDSRKKKLIKTVRESLGIVYYWFILIPY